MGAGRQKEDRMDFQRARRPEQVDQRWDEIIEATLKIYKEKSYHEITLTQIAKELSFTRANLYKYVKTKEEIFLQVILRDLHAWVSEVEGYYQKNPDLSIQDFSASWSSIMAKHERLVQLFALLHTIIEKNVSLESLTDYKRNFFSAFLPVIKPLQLALPQLSEEQANDFLQFQFAVSTGILPGTRLTRLQKDAIAASGFSYDIQSFQSVLSKFTETYLQGIKGKQ